MEQKYKFSILIGLYNHLSMSLPYLIESLKQQTYKDFEVLFCDDASNDGTKKFFINKLNLGFDYRYFRLNGFLKFRARLGKSLNQGLKKVKGKYVFFVMGDSYLKEDALEILDKMMEEEKGVCGIRWQIDRETKKIIDVDWRLKKNLIPDKTVLFPNIPKITGNGLCIPLKDLNEIGGVPELKGYGGEDDILVLKLFRKGLVFWSCPQVMIYHFEHGERTENNKENTILLWKTQKYLFSH